jgi:cytochrome c553
MGGRDWSAAWEKVEREGRCRACKSGRSADPHHVISRSRSASKQELDRPENIIPLCRDCHRKLHRAELDILPHLTMPEQAYAVFICGGLIEALQALTHQRWEPVHS